ncbi:MAG: histidinol-phosphate transaminase, partial [Anaerolineae bacterium]
MTEVFPSRVADKVRVRADIAAMQPYSPTASLEVFAAQLGIPAERLIKLDANENPYGPSPAARDALASLNTTHIYPDPEARALRALLSD